MVVTPIESLLLDLLLLRLAILGGELLPGLVLLLVLLVEVFFLLHVFLALPRLPTLPNSDTPSALALSALAYNFWVTGAVRVFL